MAKAADLNENEDFIDGQPYFCPECKRTHTKGKVYKDHVKFAQKEKPSKEQNEDIYDEEQELIEAFDEIEKEGSEFDIEDFPEEEEEDLQIEQAGNTMNDSVDAVKKLPGVGEATLNKLIKAGFNSLE
ncbi:MAG: hypothetical protein ACFFD7_16555, partial [Candidatus Thorarchaeota archaeon]